MQKGTVGFLHAHGLNQMSLKTLQPFSVLGINVCTLCHVKLYKISDIEMCLSISTNNKKILEL
jgi:hypothetical protein